MPKTKVLYCPTCKRYRECEYKGRNGKVQQDKYGIIVTMLKLLNDQRPKFWKCTKCGEIFEEF